jgi:hypothetical protein
LAAGVVLPPFGTIKDDFFPETQWQRCVVHWYRNAFNNANTAAMRHQDFLQQLPL